MSYCDGQDKDLFGSPCNPMQMGVNYTGNKDANSSEFTFTQISKGDDIAIYKGTVPSEEPVASVARLPLPSRLRRKGNISFRVVKRK